MYYIFSYALNKNLTSWECHEENSHEIRLNIIHVKSNI